MILSRSPTTHSATVPSSLQAMTAKRPLHSRRMLHLQMETRPQRTGSKPWLHAGATPAERFQVELIIPLQPPHSLGTSCRDLVVLTSSLVLTLNSGLLEDKPHQKAAVLAPRGGSSSERAQTACTYTPHSNLHTDSLAVRSATHVTAFVPQPPGPHSQALWHPSEFPRLIEEGVVQLCLLT